MVYKASLDKTTKIITALVFIILVAVACGVYFGTYRINSPSVVKLSTAATFLIVFAVLFISYLYAPKKYIVTDDEFIIHRTIGNRSIRIKDIEEIRPVDPSELKRTIRTFGSGGFFGSYGKFYNSQLGNMTWYVTQQRNRILIRTKSGQKVIISPDELSLIEKVKSRQS